MTAFWLGRVFGTDDGGGNHTAVLPTAADPSLLARSLGFADTAFVTARTTTTVAIRTFSPFEELALCIQTSLAVPVALGGTDGQTWQVEHPAAAVSVTLTKAGGAWECWASHQVDEHVGEPEPIEGTAPGLMAGDLVRMIRLPRARNRLYAELVGEEAVTRLTAPHPSTVLQMCGAQDCSGLVYFARVDDRTIRTRVFTTSLAGREDVATGGASMGLGALVDVGSQTTEVLQGPAGIGSRGRLLLRRDQGRLLIGGLVHPLAAGQVASEVVA